MIKITDLLIISNLVAIYVVTGSGGTYFRNGDYLNFCLCFIAWLSLVASNFILASDD